MRFFFSSDRHVADTPNTDNAIPAEPITEGGAHAEIQHARIFVWDGAAWQKMSQPGGAGGGDGAILDGVTPTTKATVFNRTNSKPLAVGLVDANGDPYNATGGGGGGAVTIADGADVAQGTTTDLSSASTVIGILKAIKAAITGTLATSRTWVLSSGTDSVNVGNFPATQPVSGTVTANQGGAPWSADITDRVARLLGHVTVDNASIPVTGTFWQATQPVSGTFWQATQPVSLATNTPDVTDRAARLLGHVTVDNASLAVTGPLTDTQLRASAVSVSGTVTANQGGAPWSENLTQVGGTAIAAKAVPTNADGQVALPVYVNAQQYATYDVAARNLATGALTANTVKAILSLEHSAASTKTVRIRRIMIHALQTTALAGLFDVQITRGTAASSGGTGVTPQARRLTDPAAEVVVKSLPTIVAATIADNIPAGGFGATTALYSPPVLIYDWQEAGETKPYMLVAGALQSLVINVISTVAHNLTLTISLDLTEE